MRAAISTPGLPSDTFQLVDACIAHVRSAAHLDDAAVLPPLPELPPRRDVVTFTKSQTGVVVAASSARAAPPVAVASPRRATRRWPLFLCAFVASVAGGAAFIASPVGHRPAVQQVTSSARVHATAAVSATTAWVSSLL